VRPKSLTRLSLHRHLLPNPCISKDRIAKPNPVLPFKNARRSPSLSPEFPGFRSDSQGVATTAATAYAIADAAQPFASHYTPAEVEAMLKKANELENYKALKTLDWVP
jgi:hypothetical protein